MMVIFLHNQIANYVHMHIHPKTKLTYNCKLFDIKDFLLYELTLHALLGGNILSAGINHLPYISTYN